MSPEDLTLGELRRGGWLHSVSTDRLDTLDDWAMYLEAILHEACAVIEVAHGEFELLGIKHFVDARYGMRLEVRSNEHPPPHFHITAPDIDASFRIDNSAVLHGQVSTADHNKIKLWHSQAKPLIIKAWNDTRPTDCKVGPYRGD